MLCHVVRRRLQFSFRFFQKCKMFRETAHCTASSPYLRPFYLSSFLFLLRLLDAIASTTEMIAYIVDVAAVFRFCLIWIAPLQREFRLAFMRFQWGNAFASIRRRSTLPSTGGDLYARCTTHIVARISVKLIGVHNCTSLIHSVVLDWCLIPATLSWRYTYCRICFRIHFSPLCNFK